MSSFKGNTEWGIRSSEIDVGSHSRCSNQLTQKSNDSKWSAYENLTDTLAVCWFPSILPLISLPARFLIGGIECG